MGVCLNPLTVTLAIASITQQSLTNTTVLKQNVPCSCGVAFRNAGMAEDFIYLPHLHPRPDIRASLDMAHWPNCAKEKVHMLQ